MANPVAQAAVEAVELEAWDSRIRDLVYKDKESVYNFFKQRSKTFPTAVTTARGGTARPAFFIPTRMQSGAAIFQGTGDGDALPRGTGSLWISGDLSPIFVGAGCEITWLARQATEGKKRALISLRAEELKNSLDSFLRGVDAQFFGDSSGMIVQIPATAVITIGGSGNQTSIIAGLGGQANQFQEQQVVQFFATEGGSARTTPATATVSYVDGAADTVYFSTALPTSGGGAAPGDFVVIQGASGALNTSIAGIYAYQVSSNTGTTPTNLNRATYPGQLSTPNINASGPLTPNFAYRAAIQIGRALGPANEAVDSFVWLCGPDQELANNNLYQNVLIGNIQEVKGDKSLDMTKKYMPPTFGGREMKVCYTARQGRIDAVCPETWGIIEVMEPSLYQFGDGVTTMPVPSNDGTGATTYLTSNVFYYVADLNLFQSNYKAALYITNLTVPTI